MRPLRALLPSCALVVLALASGCKASATVRRTTPVANLQQYSVAMVRVTDNPQLQHLRSILEYSATDGMQRNCAFQQVVTPTQAGNMQPDLIVDLKMIEEYRGGRGLVQNPNLVEVKVAMVLSDGIDQSLLGSAEIMGKSAAVAVNGQDPENQAVMAVGKEVASLLAKSGCSGERIARAEPDPEPTPTDTSDQTQAEAAARAEAANDAGKELFRAANVAGAKAKFQEAVALVNDPRFQFNLCLAHEALKEFDQAVRACQAVVNAPNAPRLAEKASQRLEIIAEIRAGES